MIWLRRVFKTALICLAAVGLLAIVLWRRRDKASAMQKVVTETKQSLQEVKQEAVIEIAAARRKEAGLKERLRTVKVMSDKARRREELLRLYREVSQ